MCGLRPNNTRQSCRRHRTQRCGAASYQAVESCPADIATAGQAVLYSKTWLCPLQAGGSIFCSLFHCSHMRFCCRAVMQLNPAASLTRFAQCHKTHAHLKNPPCAASCDYTAEVLLQKGSSSCKPHQSCALGHKPYVDFNSPACAVCSQLSIPT